MMMILSYVRPETERARFKTHALAVISINPRDSAVDTNPPQSNVHTSNGHDRHTQSVCRDEYNRM